MWTRIKLYIGFFVSFFGLVLAYLSKHRSVVRAEEKLQNVQDKLNRRVKDDKKVESGQNAIRNGRNSGDSLDERMRGTNDKWRGDKSP